MSHSGYYEIVGSTVNRTGLKMNVIAGNILFNRLHWHDSLEIICCIHGSVQVRIQGEAYVLKENDLVAVNCGLSHELTEGFRWNRRCCGFRQEADTAFPR